MKNVPAAFARWMSIAFVASCAFGTPDSAIAATNRLLVADDALPRVTMIDGDTGRIEGTLPTDGRIGLMVQSPKAGLVALSYRDRPRVDIRRIGSGESIDTIHLDAPPVRLLLSPDEEILAIVCADGSLLFGRLAEPGTTHPVSGVTEVSDVAFGHSGETALVATERLAGLVIVNLRQFRVTGIIRDDRTEPLPGAMRLAVSTDRRRAVVLQGDGRQLVTYDLVHGRVEARADLPEPALALHLLGDHIALPLAGGRTVALRPIDALKDEVRIAAPAVASGAVPVFGGSIGAFVSEAGRRVFLVDTVVQRVIADVPLPARPVGVATGQGSLAVYVAMPDIGRIAVIGVAPYSVSMIEAGSRHPAVLAGTSDGQCR